MLTKIAFKILKIQLRFYALYVYYVCTFPFPSYMMFMSVRGEDSVNGVRLCCVKANV